MKIVELLKIRKMIKSIDKDIKIRFGKAFECDTDRKIVYTVSYVVSGNKTSVFPVSTKLNTQELMFFRILR